MAAADILSDPSTTDSDTLNVTLTSSLSTSPTISNVEKINADFKGFNLSLAAGSITKGTMVVSTSQEYNDKAQVSGLSSAGGLNFEIGTGIKTLTLSGTTASTAVKLSGGSFTLADTGITTLTLNSATAANTVTLSDAAITTLVATGDKDLTVSTNFNNLTTDTVTNSLTNSAKLTLKNNTTLSAAVDLTKANATAFDLSASTGTKVVTFAAGTIGTIFNDVSASDGTFTANGSATTDVLNITANKTMSGTLKTSGYETVNLVDASTASQSLTSADFTGATLKVSGPNDFTFATAVTATNLDASGLTGSAKLTLTGFTNSTATTSTITGSVNADSITVANNAAETITINAGEGANTVKAAAADTTIFAVTTGTGNDTISLGAGADTVVAGAGNDTIDGAAGNDYIIAGEGNDQVTIGAGSDYVNAGAGDDIVIAGANYAAGDTLDGGAGNDALQIDGSTVTFDTSFTGFEAIQFSADAATSLTFVDANVAAGSTFTIDYTKLTSNVATATALTVVGSAETDGKFNIIGGVNANTITTGAGNDTIVGGAEADVLKGGKGVDSIDVGKATAGKIDTVKFDKGDSGSLTSLSSGMSTVGFDVVKQAVAGADTAATKIDLSSISTFTTSTTAANLTISAGTVTTAPTLSNNKAQLIEGIYNAATNTFAYSNSGTDMLLVYDTDSSTATAFEGVVLVGVATTGLAANATFVNGTLQLQNAA